MTAPFPPLVLIAVALVLLATLLVGLIRIWRGPDLTDRMLTTQLFGTTGIALLLVLGELQDIPALRNAALLLALLAVMSTVAFSSRVWRPDRRLPQLADEDEPRGGSE